MMIKKAQISDEFFIKTLLDIQNDGDLTSENIANTINKSALKNAIENDVFLMQIKTLFLCYGTQHPDCDFYFVSPTEDDKDNTGLLCIRGKTAIYSGPFQETDEIELFLQTLQVDFFKSNNLVLPNFKLIPQYTMRLKAGIFPDVFAIPVEDEPNLWDLAHSNIISNIESEAFYSDISARVKNGFADIRAICEADETGKQKYVATASVYTKNYKTAYLTDIETKKEHRSKGYACTLISTLARAYPTCDKIVVCQPSLEHFYERLGFVFMRPVCLCERV